MATQHAKWLEACTELPWRASVPSLNYLLTSTWWRNDHNGFSHQGAGFTCPRSRIFAGLSQERPHIGRTGTSCDVCIVPTDEDLMIARATHAMAHGLRA